MGGGDEDNWEDAIDRWREKRQQKRTLSSELLELSGSFDGINRTQQQPVSSPQSRKSNLKIKTFQQMLDEKAEREKWRSNNENDFNIIKDIETFSAISAAKKDQETPLVTKLAAASADVKSETVNDPIVGHHVSLKSIMKQPMTTTTTVTKNESYSQRADYSIISQSSLMTTTTHTQCGFEASLPVQNESFDAVSSHHHTLSNQDSAIHVTHNHLPKQRAPPRIAPKPTRSDKSPTTKIRGVNNDGAFSSESSRSMENISINEDKLINGIVSNGKPEVTFFYFMPSTDHDDGGGSVLSTESSSRSKLRSSSLNVTVSQGNQLLPSSLSSTNGGGGDGFGFGFGLSGGNGEPVLIKNVVTDVSSTNLCNLKENDEVLSVNGHKVKTLSHDDVVSLMSSAVQSGNVCLRINRMGMEVTCKAAHDKEMKGVETEKHELSFEKESLQQKEQKEKLKESTSLFSCPNDTNDVNDYPNRQSVSADNANTNREIVQSEMAHSDDHIEDLVVFEEKKQWNYQSQLQNVPRPNGFQAEKTKQPLVSEPGKVKNSRDFFEQITKIENDGSKEKSVALKNDRKNQEIQERRLEAQRGRKYDQKFEQEQPVKYEFSLDDDFSYNRSKSSELSSSTSHISTMESQLAQQTGANSKKDSKRVEQMKAKVVNQKQPQPVSTSSRQRANDSLSKQQFLLQLASNEHLDDLMAMGEEDVNSEMEEFEAEFESQQQKLRQKLQKTSSTNSINHPPIEEEKELEEDFIFEERRSVKTEQKNKSKLNDPMEEVFTSHRPPSRASGVIQPASYTPQSSLNTTVDSQEDNVTTSFNSSKQQRHNEIMSGVLTANTEPTDQPRFSSTSVVMSKVQNSNHKNEKVNKNSRQNSEDEDGASKVRIQKEWPPHSSGPIQSQIPTILFDPTKNSKKQQQIFSKSRDQSSSNGFLELNTFDEDLSDEFLNAKKVLDKKFRIQKRDLYNVEAARIEDDQNELDRLEFETKRSGDASMLRNLKRNYAENQRVKDREFEITVEKLKRDYEVELNALCKTFNRGSSEAFMESDMRIDSSIQKQQGFELDKDVSSPVVAEKMIVNTDMVDLQASVSPVNLSPRKYDLVKKWAEDTTQSMELKAIVDDDNKNGYRYNVEHAKGSHSQMRLHSTNNEASLNESNRSYDNSSNRTLMNETRHSVNYIKKRPISGITKNDSNQLQTYLTSENGSMPRRPNSNDWSLKHADSRINWLDTLKGSANASLPKVPRPRPDNFVERIDLPSKEETEDTSAPIPDDVINAIIERLKPSPNQDDPRSNNIGSNKNNNNNNKSGRNKNHRHKDPQNREPNTNLRKWKSAPFDVNEEDLTPKNESYHDNSPFDKKLRASSRTDLFTPNQEFIDTRNSIVRDREVRPNRSNDRKFKDLPPIPLDQLDSYPVYNTNIHVPQRSSSRYPTKPTEQFTPNPVFQEMSVDDPERQPKVWNPHGAIRPQTDTNNDIPWNARGRDYNMAPVDKQTLTRRFELRDTRDPHGFNTITRASNKAQGYPPPNMGNNGWSYSNRSMVPTPASTLTGNVVLNNKPKQPIASLTQTYQREMSKREAKMGPVSAHFPCSGCGIRLGKGSAVTLTGLNLVFHQQCFKCSICNQFIETSDVGTNVEVKGSTVHCESCRINSKGYQYTQC